MNLGRVSLDNLIGLSSAGESQLTGKISFQSGKGQMTRAEAIADSAVKVVCFIRCKAGPCDCHGMGERTIQTGGGHVSWQPATPSPSPPHPAGQVGTAGGVAGPSRTMASLLSQSGFTTFLCLCPPLLSVWLMARYSLSVKKHKHMFEGCTFAPATSPLQLYQLLLIQKLTH